MPSEWDQTIRNEMRMGLGMLDIEVPMIAAVNGPALRHSELPLLCDVVLASTEATFMDSAHFPIGAVPGDPVHVVYPLLMGLNRGRYFLLTGETLDARRALEFGLVNEVMPRERLMPRARQLAAGFAARSLLALRYSRILLTHRLKRDIQETLGYGMALAGLTQIEKTLGPESS
jgi:enoyl-CoA hydratase/carnithine racemase